MLHACNTTQYNDCSTFLQVLQIVMQHSFFPMCAGGLLSVAVSKSKGCIGCPVVVAEGQSQTVGAYL